MKPVRSILQRGVALVIGRLLLSAWLQSAASQPTNSAWDRYIWQEYRSSDIPASASNLVTELRSEIGKILEAGPLAPIRTVYADLEQDPYFMYWQGGRIITTLAMAWPYLTPDEQDMVLPYVRSELNDEARAPWAPGGHLPPDQGARRELHPFHEARGWDRYWALWGHHKPMMGSFYGLWLYADRSGDWATLQAHYTQLTNLYLRKADQCDLYGTMGAHIAMARIARHFDDRPLLRQAEANAASAFQSGARFGNVEAATRQYWKERFEPRQQGLVYQGWMFLDLCPEVGRYLAEHVRADTLARHAQGLKQYPFFWLREVPYWSRWTGDEGLGIPTELMGMLVPVERWVANASPVTLASYLRSAPLCTGDCYWIEALILAIESDGRGEWKMVQDNPLEINSE